MFKVANCDGVSLWLKLVVIWGVAVLTSAPWTVIAVHRNSNYVDGTPIKVGD